MKSFLCISLLGIFLCFSCKHKNSDQLSFDEKLAILDAKIKKEPKKASLYISRARIFLEMERLNDAIIDCNQAIQYDDKKPDYYLLLSDLYFLKGNVELCYQNIRKSIEIDPKNADAYLKLGEISFYNKDYERALESLQKSIDQKKINPDAAFLKAYIYKETGDTFAAVDWFKKTIDQDPAYSSAYEELGILYSLKKDPLTEEYLNTAIELNPNNFFAMYALALYYQENDHIDQALALYENILSVNPKHIDALNNLGFIYLEYYQNNKKALEFFDNALEIKPDFLQALYNRGSTFELINQKDKALIDFEKIKSVNPDYLDIEEKILKLSHQIEKPAVVNK